MELFRIFSVASALLIGAFFYSPNLATGIDYSALDATYIPMGVTYILGVMAISSVGGTIGAWFDGKDEN